MNNPVGLDGFAFLEFSGSDKQYLHQLFINFGFTKTQKHKTKDIAIYQQGETIFILNAHQHSQASEHATLHGFGACAMGFYVHDNNDALTYTIEQGATAYEHHDKKLDPNRLAIEGIGGSLIYFCSRDEADLFPEFEKIAEAPASSDSDLYLIDHLTHNVRQGNMDTWANFYINLFNFHEIRFFDIKGEKTGLLSRAMGSPCGKIKIPLNESKDEISQIEEFLKDYKGEGIQHIALKTENIYESVENLRANGIDFLDVPHTYYEMIADRVNWHTEDLVRMEKNALLIDGDPTPAGGLLLQIFTKNLLGPAFFEIIQRKGNDGFGEGNFTALFEAIERDQIQRGVI